MSWNSRLEGTLEVTSAPSECSRTSINVSPCVSLCLGSSGEQGLLWVGFEGLQWVGDPGPVALASAVSPVVVVSGALSLGSPLRGGSGQGGSHFLGPSTLQRR